MPKNIHHLTILQNSNKSNEDESSKNTSPVTNTVTSSTTTTTPNTNVINNPNPATKQPSKIALNKTNIELVTDAPKKASLPGYSTFKKIFLKYLSKSQLY
jgi:hypothetical protein